MGAPAPDEDFRSNRPTLAVLGKNALGTILHFALRWAVVVPYARMWGPEQDFLLANVWAADFAQLKQWTSVDEDWSTASPADARCLEPSRVGAS